MFFNPLLLVFGVGGVAVPIIIHLLHRRKFRKVVWAAMRFIQVATEKNQRRMQIEDLILLAIRCLVAALVALALARPMLNALSILDRGRVVAVIVLDNSYSMSQTDGTQSRFDQAKKLADGLLERFGSGSSAAVYLASDSVEEVIPQPTFDLNLARERIHQAGLCDRTTDLLPAIQRGLKVLEERPGTNKELYVLTDGQASGFRQLPAMQSLMEGAKAKGLGTNVVIVGEPEVANLGVSDFRMASAMSPMNQPLRFEVQVTNYGLTEVRAVPVRLSIDNGPPSEETLIDVIPAKEKRSVSFYARLRTEGFHTVTAKLPRDHLPADDSRSIVVRATKQTAILLVDGSPGREAREGQTFFVGEALHPVDPARQGDYFLQAKTVSPSELEGVRIDEFDVIVLADVQDVSAGMVKRLEKFVRDGGGLMVFPGPSTSAAFYNEQFFRQRGMLPAMIGEAKGDSAQAEVYVTFQTRSLEHPIVSVWNAVGGQTLAGPRFYRTVDLQLPKGAATRPAGSNGVPVGASNVVLRYSDGRPAVVERAWGLGRVILFSSTANTAWNDLAVRPKAFIPLMHRCVGSILQRQDEQLNARVGQKVALRVSSDLLGRDGRVTRPDTGAGGTGTLPDIRRVELQDAWPTLTYDRTDLAGIYAVTVDGEANATRFACQADPVESVVDPLGKESLEAIKSVANLTQWKAGGSMEIASVRSQQGSELWWYFLVAGLVLAGAETVLAWKFSQSK